MGRIVSAAVALLLGISACTSGARPPRATTVDERDDRPRPVTSTVVAQAPPIKEVRLRRFSSCAPLLRHLRRETARQTGPWGIAGIIGYRIGPTDMVFSDLATAPSSVGVDAGASGSAPAFSATNVQEAGVDEPDIVKTDGRRILTIRRNTLYILTVANGTPTLAGSLPIEGDASELLLDGDRALVMRTTWTGTNARSAFGAQRTIITVVDIADPAEPRTTSTITVEGSYLSARMVNGIARVVIRSRPAGFDFAYPSRAGRARPLPDRVLRERNRARVRRASLDHWLPEIEVRRGRTVRRASAVRCDDVHRPRAFSGLDMVSVLTIDPKNPDARDAVSVMADAEHVYASADRLTVATNRWEWRNSSGGYTKTELHSFDISDPRATTYRASGQVPGSILDQWAMSEHDGYLRVASTMGWGDKAISRVTVLRERSGALVHVGRVGGMGRGERIYSVRFMGDVAYVVTFRQVDPLYVLDLSDPASPRITGELKIPGYSAYLHPIGDGLLVGVGAAASDEGRVEGMQISLFDVSDPQDPKRLHAYTLPGGSTAANADHHAFLWWPKTNTLVIPMERWSEGGDAFQGASAFHIDRARGIEEAARIEHPGDDWQRAIRRTLVIDDALFSLSETGIMVSALDTFAQRIWIGWPPTFGTPSTYAGAAKEGARLSTPGQLAFSPKGVLFAADPGAKRVVWIDEHRRARAIEPFPALREAPTGIAVENDGSVIVATECALWRIREPFADRPALDLLSGGACGSAQDGDAAVARFGELGQIALDKKGSIVAADTGAHAIRRIDTRTGAVTTLAGRLGVAGDDATHLRAPESVHVLGDGDLIIADTGNGLLRRAHGASIRTLARGLVSPSGVSFDAPSGTIVVAERRKNRIRGLWRGELITLAGPGATGGATTGLHSPASVLSHRGHLFIADTGTGRILAAQRS